MVEEKPVSPVVWEGGYCHTVNYTGQPWDGVEGPVHPCGLQVALQGGLKDVEPKDPVMGGGVCRQAAIRRLTAPATSPMIDDRLRGESSGARAPDALQGAMFVVRRSRDHESPTYHMD